MLDGIASAALFKFLARCCWLVLLVVLVVAVAVVADHRNVTRTR